MNAPNPASGLRERILAEATRLFAVQGFSATSIRELVEACECTRPALYYYFGSKEDLYREITKKHLDHVEGLIRSWQSTDGSVREQTHSAADAFIDYAVENAFIMRLVQRIEKNPEDTAPEVNICAARELHLRLMTQSLEAGIRSGEVRDNADPADCALVVAGTISFQFELALATDSWDRERIHRTIDLIFDGIAA